MNRKRLILVMWVALLFAAAGCGGGGDSSENTTSICQQGSGSTYVGLEKQGAYIYNNPDVSDPLALCQNKHAVISKVSNNSGSDISLSHGGPFIILNSGTSVTDFNGQTVEGSWSAQRGGDVNGSPTQISIQVEWRRP